MFIDNACGLAVLLSFITFGCSSTSTEGAGDGAFPTSAGAAFTAGASSVAGAPSAGGTSVGGVASDMSMGGAAVGGVATSGSDAGGGGSGGTAAAGGSTGAGEAGAAGIAGKRARILAYLASISGKNTIAGQHNKEPSSDPTKWTRYVEQNTGKTPGLWSGDFLFRQADIDSRGSMIAEARRQFDAGALINLMWHACPPSGPTGCKFDTQEGAAQSYVVSHLNDQQWQDLVTEGGGLNTTWKQRMDQVAVYLQQLEDAGVVVMLRPFHEMNQSIFWWAGRPGQGGTARLYQLTHDYFVKTKGLENLIWIWDMQDLSGYAQVIPTYNPGPDFFDVAALDVYEGFNQQKYDVMLGVAGSKPIAIGECSKLPTPSYLAQTPKWAFFMAWAELVQQNNSTDELKALYSAERVLTRDELPGWAP